MLILVLDLAAYATSPSLFHRKSEWLKLTNTLKSDLGISFNFYQRNDQPDEIRKITAGDYPEVVTRYANAELHLFMSEGEISGRGKSPMAIQQAVYKNCHPDYLVKTRNTQTNVQNIVVRVLISTHPCGRKSPR
jgi:hypothetical protein